jgi:hypothetical protein
MKENKTNNGWVTIVSANRKRTEKDEKARLLYWTGFWNKKNSIKATCASF